MATKTFVCDVDYTDRHQGTTQQGGNGWERHLFVGYVSNYFYRSYVHFAMDWSGVGRITQAQLHVATVTAITHGTNGIAPEVIIKPLSQAIGTETVDGENIWTSPNKHLTLLNSPFVQAAVSPADDVHTYIDITSMVEEVAPASVSKFDGSPGGGKTHYGFILASSNQASHEKFVRVYGRASTVAAALRISIVLTYDPAPSAPNAPTSLNPVGSVLSPVDFTGLFSDVNSGDYLDATNIKLFTVGGGTVLWDKTFVATSQERDAGAFSVPIPALVRSGITYEWNARVRDQSGRWGPFLPGNVSFVRTNAIPSCSLTTPSGSYASLSQVRFKGSFTDTNSTDRLSALRIQVRVSTAPGHPDWDADTNHWDTGEVPPTWAERNAAEFSRVYGGKPLAVGAYSWRARVSDRWGTTSAWAYGTFTMSTAWTPDPGAIDFLTGYNDKKTPTRVVIRGYSASTRGPVNPPLAIIEDAANIGGSAYLNAPGEFYMTLPARHPQLGVIEPYQTHYAVEVWNGDRYREVYAGVITDFDATDDDIVFYGTDYLGMLNKTVDQRYSVTSPNLPHTAGGSKYVDQTITTIVDDQLTMARAKSNSWVNFIATAGGNDTFSERATIYSSFIATFDFISGLLESHRQGTGKRSRFWVRRNAADTGYEFVMKDAPGKERNNLRMEYGGLVQGFRLTGFGQFATHMHGFGRAREGVNVYYASETATGIDPAIFGRVDDVRAYDAVNDSNDLKRRLKQEAARAARIGKRVALGLRVDSLLPFDGFDITDSIPLNIVRGAVDTNAYGSGYWDVLGVEFRVFPDAHTETTLILLPREDNVAPDPNLIPGAEVLAGSEWEVGYVPPVQGTNVSKFYVDLTTGKTYQKNADGTYTQVQTPALPSAPTGLSLYTEMVADPVTGAPLIKLTANLIQPAGTANRGSWVEITYTNNGDTEDPQPVWTNTILLFIPAGSLSASVVGVPGSTLYFARAWSVDFVGVPSTVSAGTTVTSVKDTTAPNVPVGSTSIGTLKGFLAGWEKTQAKDLAFFHLRFAVDDGSGTGPGSTPTWSEHYIYTTFFAASGLLAADPGGTKYWWQVRAVDTSGNVEQVSAQVSPTGEDVDDFIDLTAHGYQSGDIVYFTAKTGGSALALDTDYFVVNQTADAFQIAATLGGSPLSFGSDITASTMVHRSVARNYLTFPEVGWAAKVSAQTSLVDNTFIQLGAIGDQHIQTIGLSASVIKTGILQINTSTASLIDGIQVLDNTGVEIGRWNETGLYVRSLTNPNNDYVLLHDAGLTVYLNGTPASAITPQGINATAITFGAIGTGHNVVPNSGFEVVKDSTSPTITNYVWTINTEWNTSRVGSDTNVTTNAGDLQQTLATF